MKTKDWLLSIVSAVIWYFFIYYLMFAIKTDVDLWYASLVLLVLVSLGIVACPLVYRSKEWKKLFKK